ncbi:MAG: family 20 glycosylhydrolase [Rikenellaceae bacterium]|nr:family 20 glycosylhydrolase [Rikenellaceae bacterium]
MKNKLILILCLLLPSLGGARNLVPQPVKAEWFDGRFPVSASTVIVTDDCTDLAAYLNEYLAPVVGAPLAVTPAPRLLNAIRLRIVDSLQMPAEGYLLSVTQGGIDIRGKDRGGVFNALQIFLQLLPASVYTKEPAADPHPLEVPFVAVVDYPRYAYRGMMLDVARTFFPKEMVLKYIDNLSHHKINRLHWHLADDEGWRIEIKGYPRLTEVGAWRGPDEKVPPIYGAWDRRYGGFFTQDDIREVVAYAAMRNVEIVPEIDLPGHSRAVGKAYPEILCPAVADVSPRGVDRRNVWCAAREENYAMLAEIVRQLAELFPGRYIHLGGDEVEPGQWNRCPECKRLMTQKGLRNAKQLEAYFMERMGRIVASQGKLFAGWDEVVDADTRLPDSSVVHGWQSVASCGMVADKGYPVIVMPGSYFYIDMRQSPDERGQVWAGMVDTRRVYSFEPAEVGFTPAQQQRIHGIEGGFWSELGQPDGFLEYQSYPRICALSEVGWSQPEARNWNGFYRRLTTSHLDRLAAMGIGYRVFPAEVELRDGQISVTPPFPGAEVRYTAGGGVPGDDAILYTGPLRADRPQDYLFRTFHNGRQGPVQVVVASRTEQIGAGATRTYELPLSELVDRDGLWYLKVYSSDPGLRITSLRVVAPDTSYTIIRNGAALDPLHNLRFYAEPKARAGVMRITVSNPVPRPGELRFEFRPSPYIEPSVTLTSTIPENRRFPLANATDYNFSSYVRTAGSCVKGDRFTYTFKQPVDCESIEVRTGLYYMPRYLVPSGYVEWSSDGATYRRAGDLADGVAVIRPSGPVKAVRIVSTADGNGETAVALQDLKIKPRRR